MKFLFSLLTLIAAAAAVDLAFVSAIFADLQANSAEYVSYIQANPQAYPASLYAIVQKITTQSDWNYLTTAFPTAEYQSFMSKFPGASRVSSEIAAAEAAGSGAATATSTAASSGSSSAAASSKTSAASSGASSSAATSSKVASSSSAASSAASSSAASNSSSGAAPVAQKASAMVLLPLAVFGVFALAF